LGTPFADLVYFVYRINLKEKMHNANPQQEENVHKCTSVREGDWVTFRCSKCPDYVYRMNVRTGKMTVPRSVSPYKHSGLHIPMAIQPNLYNPN
jgi:hypothetical protein